MSYFTDREFGPVPRTLEELTPAAWKGIAALVRKLVETGAFASTFPEHCSDGNEVVCTDARLFGNALQGEIPWLEWPIDPDNAPQAAVALDLVEFCYQHVAWPEKEGYHSFWKHYHLAFDKKKGQNNPVRHSNCLV